MRTAKRIIDPRGKEKFVYRRYTTPCEVLRQLSPGAPDQPSYLKPSLSITAFDQMAQAQRHRSASDMQAAQRKLFLTFH